MELSIISITLIMLAFVLASRMSRRRFPSAHYHPLKIEWVIIGIDVLLFTYIVNKILEAQDIVLNSYGVSLAILLAFILMREAVNRAEAAETEDAEK